MGSLEKIDRFLLSIKTESDTYRCFDCLDRNNGYTVHDRLWDLAWPHHEEHRQAMHMRAEQLNQQHRKMVRQFLCLPCLEVRLGRSLTIDDFDDVPINRALRFGYRLGLTARNRG
jgi:hypothetical protein